MSPNPEVRLFSLLLLLLCAYVALNRPLEDSKRSSDNLFVFALFSCGYTGKNNKNEPSVFVCNYLCLKKSNSVTYDIIFNMLALV